jgi:hypothetical protein
MSAGDYRLFRSENAQNRSPETGGQFAKARHWRAFLRVSGTVSPSAGLPGWAGGFEPPHGGIKIHYLSTSRSNEQLSCSELTGTRLGSIPTVMKAAGSKPINFQNNFKGI